jgi:hypothetical protein
LRCLLNPHLPGRDEILIKGLHKAHFLEKGGQVSVHAKTLSSCFSFEGPWPATRLTTPEPLWVKKKISVIVVIKLHQETLSALRLAEEVGYFIS